MGLGTWEEGCRVTGKPVLRVTESYHLPITFRLIPELQP